MALERVDKLFAGESWTTVYTAFTNVSLKAYDFDNIREALLTYVSETYPDKFNDLIASSEFVAIVDLVAYFGHALAFRMDMNTRENFLDTAERRESILRMARTLGYNKTRPLNARGFMKIKSVRTTEDVYDSTGNTLANRVIRWNDPNDVSWYDNFVTVLNSALDGETKLDQPAGSALVNQVKTDLFFFNEDNDSKSVKYSFNSTVAGKGRTFETVRAKIDDNDVVEAMPDPERNITLISRSDNLGPSSDRTGFFMYAKAGDLQYRDFHYTSRLSNRIEVITEPNISNSDVWIQRIDDNGKVLNEVKVIDNDTRETAIYNIFRDGNGDMASIHTADNNQIRIQYPDGIFGNAAYGRYRVWFRKVENEAFSVNSNDIKEASINITYRGADNRSYRLTLTLESTRDFAENFEGENYTSVRRIAPRAYYAQDRMVNGQDYNILPYTLGTNIVTKLKSVNTTFAGNSRYFEASDVTGHHSNIHVTGTDGSVYVDEDEIYLSMLFQRGVGDARNFIANRLVQVLKHPSMLNNYFYSYRGEYDFDKLLAEYWQPNALDPLRGRVINPIIHELVESGDYLRLRGEWFQAQAIDINGDIVLDRILVKNDINEVIGFSRLFKAPVTKFSEQDIDIIEEKLTDESTESFYVFFDVESYSWNVSDANPNEDLQFLVTYAPGTRENTSKFEITFTGKKVVFESANQVKFYYNNEDIVIDSETNLATRDTLSINYNDGSVLSGELGADKTEYKVNIAYAPINYTLDENTGLATICADFALADGITNASFFNMFENEVFNNGPEIVEKVDYKYELATPFGPVFLLEKLELTGNGTLIGEAPEYQVCWDNIVFDDISSDLLEINIPTSGYPVTDSDEINISDTNATSSFLVENLTACNTPSFYTIQATPQQLIDRGFKGEPTLEYFNSAGNEGKFMWIDESDLPGTIEDAQPGDKGVQTQFSTTWDPANEKFVFTIPKMSTFSIDLLDNDQYDIFFKQVPYGEIEFVYDENDYLNRVLDEESLYTMTLSKEVYDQEHIELVDRTALFTNTYAAVYWTTNPGVGETVTAWVGTIADNLNNYHVKLSATISVSDRVRTYTERFKEIETYIADKFLTPSGHEDNHKVELTTISKDRNPTGMLDIMHGFDIEKRYSVAKVYEYDEDNTFIISSSTDGSTTNNAVVDTLQPGETEPPLIHKANGVEAFYDLRDNNWWILSEVNIFTQWSQVADTTIYKDSVPFNADVEFNSSTIRLTRDDALVSLVRTGGLTVATTANAHGINVGDYVQVKNVTDTSFNGYVLVTDVTATTFTYQQVDLADATANDGEFFLKVEYRLESFDERVDFPKHVILQSYNVAGLDYERVYEYGYADYGSTEDNDIDPDSLIYVEMERQLDNTATVVSWYVNRGGVWVALNDFTAEDYTLSADKTQIVIDSTAYRVVEGISYAEDNLMGFRWDHYADKEKRIDIDTSNIIDMYVLSTDYVNRVNEWISNQFNGVRPSAPNAYELRKIMKSIEPKAAIADHISYIPVKFKYLFGEYADTENQAYFDVIKRQGSPFTNSETKTAVATKINEYFALSNWDFGDTFYFSELAAYLHAELGDYISSVKINPKLETSTLGDVLSITCEKDEIFLAVTSSKDINIVDNLSK